MADAIEAEGLQKRFGSSVTALAGVSFAVPRGTVLGLLGPNGAGKTTAVRILTTILRPDGGSARVLGQDVVHRAQAVRRSIGLAGQYAAVDENLTGRENLTMVGRLSHLTRAVVRDRAGQLLEQFGLTEAGDRPLKTFSGGMRRRLDLAAALVARPPVLFLDEPTTGLDPQSRNDLWAVIEDLVAEGTTVLLTTQYLEEADRLATRIAVVDHGTVIAEGTPASLKAELGTTVLAIGFGGHEEAARARTSIGSLGSRPPAETGSTVELAVGEGPRTAVEVLRRLDDAGLSPTSFVLREPSLDDVFLTLTGHRTTDEAAGAGPSRTGGGGR